MFILLVWYLVIYPFQKKKHFTNFSKSFSWQFFCFRLDRPTEPVDRSLCPGHARLCMSVGRPIGRPTESSLLSGFLGRPTGRPPSENCVSFLRPVDRSVDPSPTAICQQGGRPTGPVDRQACRAPTALSSLVQFWNLFLGLFFGRLFLGFVDLFQIK